MTSPVLADLAEFVEDHRPHGTLTARRDGPGVERLRADGHLPCGVVFELWVTPDDAELDLPYFARLN
jgi:hypothetical protein